MDTLTKYKIIDTRDFLVEVLITKSVKILDIVNNVKLLRAIREGYVVRTDYDNWGSVGLTPKGYAFIKEHKDLI
jgi:hypothetical protein